MSENNFMAEQIQGYVTSEEASAGCGCAQYGDGATDTTNTPQGATCARVHTQAADVSLPVRIKPYAKMGAVETRCCGEPVMALRHCGGTEASGGCDLLITQTICARIPVAYGVVATSGEVSITCKRQADVK